MKNIKSFLLCFLLSVSVLLTACGSEEPEETIEDTTSVEVEQEPEETGVNPAEVSANWDDVLEITGGDSAIEYADEDIVVIDMYITLHNKSTDIAAKNISVTENAIDKDSESMYDSDTMYIGSLLPGESKIGTISLEIPTDKFKNTSVKESDFNFEFYDASTVHFISNKSITYENVTESRDNLNCLKVSGILTNNSELKASSIQVVAVGFDNDGKCKYIMESVPLQSVEAGNSMTFECYGTEQMTECDKIEIYFDAFQY